MKKKFDSSVVRKILGSKAFSLLVLLALFTLFFQLKSNGIYLKYKNILSILNQMVPNTLLTVGVGCLLISGRLDLSTGAVGTMAGVVMAVLLQAGIHWTLAILAALLLGVVTGLMNGCLNNEFGFQPFIATLATSSVAKGFTYVISGSTAIDIKDEVILFLGKGKVLGNVPVQLIISIVILVIYGIMLKKTTLGRYIYILGGNPTAAKISGINPKKTTYLLYINSGVLGALAGCLMAGNLKSATVTSMVNMQFSGVTAAILGGISFGGGVGGMGGAFLGLLILNGFTNGLTVIGIGSYWQKVASGILLLLALTLDYINGKRVSTRIMRESVQSNKSAAAGPPEKP